MSNLDKTDELLRNFINEMPTLMNGKNLVEKYVMNFKDSYDIFGYKTEIDNSYKQFEGWLNDLFDKEKAQDDILAFNFGLYETEDSIQLYITGSKEWDYDDEDWACNNDYFPEGRYPNIALYNNLYSSLQDNFQVGLFLTIATTIIFANTYAVSNSTNFLEGKEFIVFATGFDDGDLYNFSKLNKEGITAIEC
ncbi:hypothetical protein [Robertmurraya sp.]|uniref:hypothetical protein n=1 Tax=Robertmurraya sp. TaxID=2837525 RepID=UPI003704B066